MAVTITPDMIKELRERTGVSIGKCKEALEKANGDINLAIDNLRKDGIASAVKKEGRTANEGKIAAFKSSHGIGIAEVNAETDFVANNDRFNQFLENIVQEVANTSPSSLEAFMQQTYSKDNSLTIDQYRATIVQAIGENIQVRRILSMPAKSNQAVGVYSHLGGKILTVAVIEGSDSAETESLAKDIAMHIAAASPEYLSPETVPESVIEHEKEIAKSQIQGKPANIVEKIIAGKMNDYLNTVCLVHQNYIKDDKMTIQELVDQKSKQFGKPLKITHFMRWAVGQS